MSACLTDSEEDIVTDVVCVGCCENSGLMVVVNDFLELRLMTMSALHQRIKVVA